MFRNSIVTSRIFYLAVAWALALTICSCSSTKVANVAPPLMPPVGEVASYTVRLDVSAGKCILSYDGPNKGQVDTGLLAPCEFLRTPVGEINARELKNTKQNGDSGYSVILVIGGPPSNEGRFDDYMKSGCRSQARTISSSPRGVALGSLARKLDVCPTDRVDEKLFLANSAHV